MARKQTSSKHALVRSPILTFVTMLSLALLVFLSVYIGTERNVPTTSLIAGNPPGTNNNDLTMLILSVVVTGINIAAIMLFEVRRSDSPMRDLLDPTSTGKNETGFVF